jgi:hypothetical protein
MELLVCLIIEQFMQNGRLPFGLKTIVHLVSYHPGSLHLLLSVSVTNGLVMHLVFLASQ